MKIRRIAAAALAALSLAAPAAAQDKYPSRPLELIVPWGPGGGADVLGRSVARWLETDLKNSTPVINMPGATGMIGLGKLVANPADGHTVAVLTGDTAMTMATTPTAQVKSSEIDVLGVMVRQPSGLFVKYDSRFKTWDDVVAAARANPGAINVATTGANSPDEFSLAVLATKGVKLTAVGYAKPAERYASVVGGHVELLYEQAGDIKGQLDGKALRPILFFAKERLPAPFADIAVSSEHGYDVLLPQFRAIVARAGTDPRRIAALVASLERFSQSAEYATYLKDQLALPDSFIAASSAQAFLRQEFDAMQKVMALATKQQ
jgi:tripartite-type tricarboxylate transporter receptor subunit TctC